jgi:hypothetical protein
MNPNLRLVQSDHVFSQSDLITINLDSLLQTGPMSTRMM